MVRPNRQHMRCDAVRCSTIKRPFHLAASNEHKRQTYCKTDTTKTVGGVIFSNDNGNGCAGRKQKRIIMNLVHYNGQFVLIARAQNQSGPSQGA